MKKITVFLGIYMIFHALAFPQNNEDFKSVFQEAEYYLNSEYDYESAVSLYLMLHAMEPDNMNIKYKIGICYLNIPGNKNRATEFLEEALKNTSPDYTFSYKEKYAPEDTQFYLGMSYHVNNQLDKAIEIYMDFLKGLSAERYQDIGFVNQQIAACERARKLQSKPENYTMVKLDEEINRHPRNFYPAISGDGNHLVYTAMIGKAYRIFYCTGKDGAWSKPIDITDQLGTNEEGISSWLSHDGQKLLIFMDDRGTGSIFESRQMNGMWTPVEKLNRNINTKYWESMCCISADGKTLYFSSNRKGGYGGLDIYKSDLDENGDWGSAVNLGPSINTPMMEDSPIILPDNITLYFSSQGHYNMGGYDLFYSVLSKGKRWSEPVNLGSPLNTTDDDMHIAPIGQGENFYCERFSYGEFPRQDIYLVNLNAEEKVLADIMISGTVQLQGRIFELDSSFYVLIIETVRNDTLKRVQVDPKTGEYSVTIPPGEYKLLITGEGYEPVEQQIMLSEKFALPDFSINTRMISTEVTRGDYLAIQNLLFDFDDYSLSDEAMVELERMVTIMNEYPSLEYEIIGHTDVIGTSSYNIQLSKRRAYSVFTYLVNRGISKNRLRTKGVGEIVAVAANEYQEGVENPRGRRLDRRVEFKIMKSDPNLTRKEESYLPDHLKNAGDLNYTVIVLKVKEKLPDDFFNSYEMEEMKYIRAEEAKDGFLYTLGVFVQRKEALSILGKLYTIGFIEARIVDQHELSDLVVSEEGPGKTIFGNPEAIGEVPVYTIQVCALKNPPGEGAFKNLENIRITPGKDKFFRFTIGEYKGYSAAKSALDEIVKMGYPESFIRRMSDLY